MAAGRTCAKEHSLPKGPERLRGNTAASYTRTASDTSSTLPSSSGAGAVRAVSLMYSVCRLPPGRRGCADVTA